MSDTSTPRDLSRRLLLGSFGAVGAASALAACSGSSTPPGAGAPSSGAFGQGDTYTGPKVALAFWNGFTGGDGPFMKGMVEEFNTANPNVTVTMNTLQWADYYAKVPNAVSSGAGPDVGIMHIDQLATNAARRVIVPLDEVASGLKLTEDDFAPVVWKAGIYQDKRYGIPLDIHPLGFYGNTGELSKAGIDALPTDQAGFEAAVKALQEKGGVKTPFWVTATWPAHLMFSALIAQFGGSIYDEEGAKATFNSDAGVESLEWLRGFVDNGASPRNVSNDAQAVAFRAAAQRAHLGRHLDDERVGEGQGAGVGRGRRADDRREAGGVGQLAQLRRDDPGHQGPQQAGRLARRSSPTSPSARSTGRSRGRSLRATACASRPSSRS